MALTTWAVASSVASSDLNNNFYSGTGISLQNHVRTLINRAGVYGKDTKDLWGEAYIDSDGRNNSVSTDVLLTQATFDTNKYKFTSIKAVGATESYTNPGAGTNSAGYTTTMTTTVSGIVTAVNIYHGNETSTTVTISDGVNSASKSQTTNLVWDNTFSFVPSDYSPANKLNAGAVTITITPSGGNVNVKTAQSYAGTKFSFTNQSVTNALTGGLSVISFREYTTATNNTIEHAVPSGTFSATVSSACIKTLFADWESGCSVTHELKNATETSGTIVDGEIKNFTAFTSQPTKIITTLTPKGSGPTAGYPAIYGMAGQAL